MKYCTKCGNELMDEAVICPKCGCATGYQQPTNNDGQKTPSTLKTVAKIFMIIGTVAMGLSLFLIPLAWCIPMTVSYCNKVKKGEPISTGFKICSLLFVSLVAGILMLCDQD